MISLPDGWKTSSICRRRRGSISLKDRFWISPYSNQLIKKVDSVFHLAAVVGVERIIEVPVEAIEINVLGSHNVLTLASRYNKPCLITSTSEVYGKSTKQPFTEDDDVVYGPTTKSRWSYACSKAIDEFLGLAYHNTQNLPVVIARLFNTTGPRQTGRYGMVLPRFVEQALRGEPITVFGSGTADPLLCRCFGCGSCAAIAGRPSCRRRTSL